MGRNMRTRIFWPVLAVILFLTAGVWISFAATSEQYAAYTAEKYTAEMIGTVEEGKENIYREAQSLQNRKKVPYLTGSGRHVQSFWKKIPESQAWKKPLT